MFGGSPSAVNVVYVDDAPPQYTSTMGGGGGSGGGALVVGGCADGKLRVWDAETPGTISIHRRRIVLIRSLLTDTPVVHDQHISSINCMTSTTIDLPVHAADDAIPVPSGVRHVQSVLVTGDASGAVCGMG